MSHQKNKPNSYPIPTTCAYCGAPVIFTSNAEVYGREYGNGKCYKCTSCDAYVGVHDGSKIPLGRLANRELRALKVACHDRFDAAWRGPMRSISRPHAYKRLSEILGIPSSECHFGWFDKDMLSRCLSILDNPRWYAVSPE